MTENVLLLSVRNELKIASKISVFGTFSERYDRDVLLLGPCLTFYNIGGGVLPTLDQVWPLNSSSKMI